MITSFLRLVYLLFPATLGYRKSVDKLLPLLLQVFINYLPHFFLIPYSCYFPLMPNINLDNLRVEVICRKNDKYLVIIAWILSLVVVENSYIPRVKLIYGFVQIALSVRLKILEKLMFFIFGWFSWVHIFSPPFSC